MRLSPAVVAQVGGVLCAAASLFLILPVGWALLILGLGSAAAGTLLEYQSPPADPAPAPDRAVVRVPKTVLDGVDPRGDVT